MRKIKKGRGGQSMGEEGRGKTIYRGVVEEYRVKEARGGLF